MQPLSEWPEGARGALRGVFFDVDDTLSTDGRITADAYAGLEMLQEANLLVVPKVVGHLAAKSQDAPRGPSEQPAGKSKSLKSNA